MKQLIYWIFLIALWRVSVGGVEVDLIPKEIGAQMQKMGLNSTVEAYDHAQETGFWPLDEHYLLMQTIALNNWFEFLVLPSLNHDHPDFTTVLENLHRIGADGPSCITQMKIQHLGDNFSLYSRQDAEYPIILLDACGGRVAVRGLSKAGKREMKLIHLKSRKGNGKWENIPEEGGEDYLFYTDGEWFFLQLPPNTSDEFRQFGLSIETVSDYPRLPPDTGTFKMHRNWIFIQLPWTDDVEIIKKLPLCTLSEYLRNK